MHEISQIGELLLPLVLFDLFSGVLISFGATQSTLHFSLAGQGDEPQAQSETVQDGGGNVL
jgi:hypothetical protein